MADRYITTAQLDALIGTSVRSSLTSDVGADLTITIELATAEVQTALRNSGYECPAANGTTTLMEDGAVVLATGASVWELLASRPEYGMKLPDNWERHPANVQRANILNGKANLSLPVSTRDAVGGVKFTNSSTTDTAGMPQRASRANLADY